MEERFREESNQGGGKFWKVEVELHEDEDEDDERVRRVPSRRCDPWMLPAVPEFVPWEFSVTM